MKLKLKIKGIPVGIDDAYSENGVRVDYPLEVKEKMGRLIVKYLHDEDFLNAVVSKVYIGALKEK